MIGVTASIIAALSLVLVASNHLPPKATASVIIYSAGLLAVFGFSAAYNLVNVSSWKGLLRRFHHAAIYVKIAATYTPFAVVKMGGTAGFALLGVVWAIAALGATAKLIAPGHSSERLTFLSGSRVGLHRCAKSACDGAFDECPLPTHSRWYPLHGSRRVPPWQKLPYNNAIWHGFVLVPSACHFAAIVDAVVI